MDVTVITPSLPHRWALLCQAVDSVRHQTRPVAAHAIGIDYQHRGPAAVRNALLGGVTTEWVLFLDDDDLLDVDFVEVLSAHPEADVVVPYCRFDGGSIPARYHNQPYDRLTLQRHGIFPITTMVRTSMIRAVDGFPVARYEDWEMWNAIADAGGVFTVVERELWTYRMGRDDHRTHNAA